MNKQVDVDSYWQGRWACIGGGSSGLGLVIAQQLASQGANVAIVARDSERLATAVESIEIFAAQASVKGKIISFAVNLAKSQDFNRTWIDWLASTPIDIAIAAVGRSDRGYLTQLTCDDLQSVFEANVYTSFLFSQSCVEALAKTEGTLVHIASLAGLAAAPGMGAYSIAKHAVVALSRQLRSELAPRNVRVMLVCPGPIANADYVGRYDDLVSKRHLPEELKKPAGGANLKLIDAVWLAKKILDGAERGTKEIVIPSKVRWLSGLAAIFPSVADYFLQSRESKDLHNNS